MSVLSRMEVDNQTDGLRRFIDGYLFDMGVRVHLYEVVTRTLGVDGSGMVEDAVDDIAGHNANGDWFFDLDTVVAGAPSLSFLVRYARMVDRTVIPAHVLPADRTVLAALDLFHEAAATGS